MNLPVIALSFWAVLGYYPYGEIANYSLPAFVQFDAGGYSEIGGRASWHGLFLSASIRTDLKHLRGSNTLHPEMSEYATAIGWLYTWNSRIGVGARVGQVTVEAMHVSTHPVHAWGEMMAQLGRSWRPIWESAHTEISVRVDSRPLP